MATDLKFDWPAVVVPYDPLSLQLLPEAAVGHTRNGYSILPQSPHSKLAVEDALDPGTQQGSRMDGRVSPFWDALSCSFGARHLCWDFAPGNEVLPF